MANAPEKKQSETEDLPMSNQIPSGDTRKRLLQLPFRRLPVVLKRGVLFLVALVLLPMLFAISPVWSTNIQQGEQVSIGAEEVIQDDLYLMGKMVTIDGTLKGNGIVAGDQITVNGTIEDDIYLAGETVTIEGIVKGDAVVAGRSIKVNGTVEGDVIAAGQSVVIQGTVGDDVRIAGEALVLDSKAKVADDLVAAGFSLENKKNSTVGGNLSFAGGQALLAGIVEKNIFGGMGALELRGTVGKDMNIAVGDSKPVRLPFTPKPLVDIPEIPVGLTITDSAKIGGKLTYLSSAEAKISNDAQIAGEVVREEEVEETQPVKSRAARAFGQLRRMVTLILVGWLLMKFLPGWTQDLANTIQTKPLPSFGWGIIAFFAVAAIAIAIAVATAILTVILAFTLQGLVLPVIGLGLLAYLTINISYLIFSFYVSPIILGFLGGRWLRTKAQQDETFEPFLSLFLGVVLLVFLTEIPVLGGILRVIIFFLGLGSLWLWGKKRFLPISNQTSATE